MDFAGQCDHLDFEAFQGLQQGDDFFGFAAVGNC